MSVPSVRVRLVLLLCALAIIPAWLVAQQARPAPAASPTLVNAKFERDPNQPIDEEYTK